MRRNEMRINNLIRHEDRIAWVITDRERRPVLGSIGRTQGEAIALYCGSRRAWLQHTLSPRRCRAVRVDLEAGARAAKGDGK